MAMALSPGPSFRYSKPSRPILKRINSFVLILRTISSVRSTLSGGTRLRISFSLHSTHLGLRLMMRSQACDVSGYGTNRNAQDSVAVRSLNFRKGGVQYVGD